VNKFQNFNFNWKQHMRGSNPWPS